MDCHTKELIFKVLNDVEFRFRGNKSSMPQNLISVITSMIIHKKGCQGYLAVVRDTKSGISVVENVLVVCEFLDIFSEEFLGLSSEREIEFYIDMIRD